MSPVKRIPKFDDLSDNDYARGLEMSVGLGQFPQSASIDVLRTRVPNAITATGCSGLSAARSSAAISSLFAFPSIPRVCCREDASPIDGTILTDGSMAVAMVRKKHTSCR